MSDDEYYAPVEFWTALLRGWSGRCPRCGKGPLFKGYLTLQTECRCATVERVGHQRV